MKVFLCAYNFSRRVPVPKFIKAEEKLKIKSENEIKKDQPDEIEQMAGQFQGTKTMKLVDKLIDEQLKKGLFQKGIAWIKYYKLHKKEKQLGKHSILIFNSFNSCFLQNQSNRSDDLKKAFQTDAVKSELVKLKAEKMEQEFQKLQEQNPDLYNFIQTNTNKQNQQKGEPQYSHAKKDKKQNKDQQQDNNKNANNNSKKK